MRELNALSPQEQVACLTALAKDALRHWGVRGCSPRLIKYRENAVFEVVDRHGARAVLRVHRQGYHSVASLHSELSWMAMLAQGGLVVPEPVPTDSGERSAVVSVATVAGDWQVDMLTWLAGRELGEVGEPLDYGGRTPYSLFYAIGSTAARMHNLSSAWPEQRQMQRHAWDREGLVGAEPLWGKFWELAELTDLQRALLLEAKAALATDLDAYGVSAATYGLIHADLVPENVMLDGATVQLIDFDDAGFGWHMFELATALYWLNEEPEFDALRSGLFAGYRSERPLAARDLETLDLFFAARSLTYVGWVHLRQNTEVAESLTPIVIERAVAFCRDYLQKRTGVLETSR